MQERLQILLIVASLFVFISILNNIRNGRLREEYSLIWLLSAALILILAVFRGSLRLIAGLVQINYAPSLVFMVGLGLVVAIQLAQTVAISKLTLQNRDLAQRTAFLEWHVRQMLNNYEVEEVLAAELESQVMLEAGGRGDAEDHETLEIPGRRAGWSYVRFAEAVGAAGEPADAPKAA